MDGGRRAGGVAGGEQVEQGTAEHGQDGRAGRRLRLLLDLATRLAPPDLALEIP